MVRRDAIQAISGAENFFYLLPPLENRLETSSKNWVANLEMCKMAKFKKAAGCWNLVKERAREGEEGAKKVLEADLSTFLSEFSRARIE